MMLLALFTMASFLSNSVAFQSPISIANTLVSINSRQHDILTLGSRPDGSWSTSTSRSWQQSTSTHYRYIISPLFSYSSNSGRHNKRRRTSSHASSTPLFNTNHIKIRHSQPPSSSSSQSVTHQLDRLRVELIRSQLSTRLAEQRAHQLEVQLGEERKKREGLQRELNGEKERRRIYSHGGGVNDDKNRAVTTNKDATIATSTPFVGSSLDDLPPFAAALAANAEREEMEKRRKLGLLVREEEDENDELKIMDLGVDGSDNEYALNLEVDNSVMMPPRRTDSMVTAQQQDNTTGLALSNVNLNLFSTINNNTINTINSRYTPQYINDDIQTLRQNCILLTQQRAALQQKLEASENSRISLSNELKSSMSSERVLRGLQADWTRRMSDTRKEMDARKEQWKKESRAERREWKNDRLVLEQQMHVLEVERDELAALLENQKNITFVMGLFCDLAREYMASSLRESKERIVSTCCNSTARTWNRVRYYGTNPRLNRILTVGGAGGQADGFRRRDAILMWLDELVRRFKSRTQSIGRRRNGVSGDNSQPTSTANTMSKSTRSDQEVLASTEERMPLLIRKNPRRSRLSQPQTVFKRRIRNVDSDLPDFMKG